MAGESILVIDDSPTLLRIFARTLSRAGYKVRVAEGGARGVAIAKEQRPDVLLLDHVMPGFHGDDVCRALGQDVALREIPVILLSTRGDASARRAAEAFGAVDCLAKPFAPDALVDVTERAVRKYVREGTPAPRPSPKGAPAPSQREGEPETHAERLGRARALLREHLAAALDRRGDAAGATAEERAREAEGALDDDALLTLARGLVRELPECAADEEVILRGELAALGLAEVLQVLALQHQTGVLVLLRDGTRIEAYFRDGRVDWVGARNLRDEFLLGRFIVETHAISAEDLDLFLRSRSGSRKLLGAQLVKLGYIQPEDLAAALRQQSQELLYEVMRWRSGSLFFRRTTARPDHVEGARLDLAIDDVLLEGFRRLDAWTEIESAIHSFEIVFARNEDTLAAYGLDALSRDELVVLELVDGQNRVGDIVQKARMGSFEVGQILHRLLGARIVRKRVEPVA